MLAYIIFIHQRDGASYIDPLRSTMTVHVGWSYLLSSTSFLLLLAAVSSFSQIRSHHHRNSKNTKKSTQSLPSLQSSLSATSTSPGDPICDYHQMAVAITTTTQSGPPRQAISVEDLTPTITYMLQESGMQQGVINIISRHTTTAITINEREKRLAEDMEKYFLNICPPDERSSSAAKQDGVRYFHNDIDQRPDGDEEAQRCRENGWDIDNPDDLKAWRNQEPINAHSHLLSMLLGSSESIPVVNGEMVIGQWQSILLVDLDGPRNRTVGVQFLGYK
jgi:thiamine phosphate synthase YjbQ (UPF0047 family)